MLGLFKMVHELKDIMAKKIKNLGRIDYNVEASGIEMSGTVLK